LFVFLFFCLLLVAVLCFFVFIFSTGY
jgi:hypothetical protein